MSTRWHFLYRISVILVIGFGWVFIQGQLPINAASNSISGPMTQGDVRFFRIAFDSQTVVFSSDNRIPGLFELYRVAIAENTPLRLSTEITSTKKLTDFAITLDNKWVIYSVYFPQDVNFPANIKAIYRHPLDNSGISIQLSHSLAPDNYIASMWVTPNGHYVVYRVCNVAVVCQIYSALIDGTTPPIQLNKNLPIGGIIWDYRITPDGQWVVFIGEQDTDGKRELYSVPIGGPNTQVKKLNTTLPANTEVMLGLPWVSLDSQWVVYGAPQDSPNEINLYSVRVDGSALPNRLDLPSTTGQPAAAGIRAILPNHQVIYSARVNASVGYALYSVPIQGPAQVSLQLSEPDNAGYELDLETFFNTTHLVYQVCTNCSSLNEQIRIYSVPLAGPASAKTLLLDSILSSELKSWLLTPNDQKLIYAKSGGTYAVPISGPANNTVKISNTIGNFTLSPDQWRMVIRDDTRKLHSLAWTGANTQTIQLSGITELDFVPFQRSFDFSSNGQFILYLARNANNHVELYATSDGYYLNNRHYLPLINR